MNSTMLWSFDPLQAREDHSGGQFGGQNAADRRPEVETGAPRVAAPP
jgi:hypothetical protein